MQRALVLVSLATITQIALADGDPHYPESLTNDATSQPPLTREEVRGEIRSLGSVGYRVGDGDQSSYPSGIQAAERKLTNRR